MIKKRSAFLVSHHQHTDPAKWYVGMYSDWDQKNEVRRSPEDRDGLSTWLTDANDDAGNARPAFIASKNVFFPDQKEIESLELYISKYLWGGMQMTDTEKYPYAIYGIPNFKANRASADPGRNGQSHVWRIYDYPHIVMLYLPDVPYREVLSGQDQASRCRYLSRARLPDGRRLLDGADGGGEVVRGCGWNDERSVHPGADRHSRSRKERRSGPTRCAATGRARSSAS